MARTLAGRRALATRALPNVGPHGMPALRSNGAWVAYDLDRVAVVLAMSSWHLVCTAAGSALRLLFIDDSELVLRAMRRLLGRAYIIVPAARTPS